MQIRGIMLHCFTSSWTVPAGICSDINAVLKIAVGFNPIGDGEQSLTWKERERSGLIYFPGNSQRRHFFFFLKKAHTLLLLLKIGLFTVQTVVPRETPSSLSKELHSILPFNEAQLHTSTTTVAWLTRDAEMKWNRLHPPALPADLWTSCKRVRLGMSE